MAKRKNPYIEADTGYLVVDGKKYETSSMKMKDIDGIKHSDKLRLMLIDEEKQAEKRQFIMEQILDKCEKTELLTELIKKIPNAEINKAYLKLKRGDKPTKQKGCLGFKIGNDSRGYLELIGGYHG